MSAQQEPGRLPDLNKALIQINALINSTLVIDEIMEGIAEKAAHILDCDSSFIVIHEDGCWRIKFSYQLPHQFKDISFSDDELPQLALASDTKKPIPISDISGDSHAKPKILQQIGVKSALIIPLMVRNVVIGGLCLNYHARQVHFEGPDIDFAGQAASSVALALSNASLYEELRQSEAKLIEAKKLCDALGEIQMLIHSSLETDRIIDCIIKKGTEAIEAESAMVLFQRGGQFWEVTYAYGLPEDLVGRKYESELIRHSIIAIKNNKPVAIDDVRSDDRVDQGYAEALGIKSLLDFPLLTKEKLIGDVVFHYHSKPTAFSDVHIDFAGKLASSLALALENAMLFQELKSSEEALRRSEEHLKLEVEEHQNDKEILKQTGDELARRVLDRTQELEKSHEQLLHSEKLAAVGNFSASIAHEFNSPLQSVLTIMKQIAEYADLKEDEDKLIDLAIQECKRMVKLIGSLQQLYKPTSGKIEPVDLHAIFDALLLIMKKNFQVRKIYVIKKYDAESPVIRAVSDQMTQVFLNLLNNAADACESGGVITIATENIDGETVAVHVEDTGVGIDPDSISHIFEPFYTTKRQKGTGLGLSISHDIIVKHGGQIEVKSENGRGTVFSVFLPVKAVNKKGRN